MELDQSNMSNVTKVDDVKIDTSPDQHIKIVNELKAEAEAASQKEEHPKPPHPGVVSQPVHVAVDPQFGRKSIHMACTQCMADVDTDARFKIGSYARFLCVALCMSGVGAPCCLIPFCVRGTKDVIHTCPNCHEELARNFHRFS